MAIGHIWTLCFIPTWSFIGLRKKLKANNAQDVLGALAVFAFPFLAKNLAMGKEAVAFAQSIGQDFGLLAPDLNVNGVVDPVAILVFTFADAAVKLGYGSVPNLDDLRLANDANSALCIQAPLMSPVSSWWIAN